MAEFWCVLCKKNKGLIFVNVGVKYSICKSEECIKKLPDHILEKPYGEFGDKQIHIELDGKNLYFNQDGRIIKGISTKLLELLKEDWREQIP